MKTIRFIKKKFIFIGLSIVLFVAGVIGYFVQGGFNLGVDFSAGLSERVMIADPALGVSYTGDGTAELNVAGAVVSIAVTIAGETTTSTVALADDKTVGAAAAELDAIENIDASAASRYTGAASSRLLSLNRPEQLAASPVSVAITVGDETTDLVSIDRIRTTLASLGNVQIQSVGGATSQEFLIRLQDSGTIANFSTVMSERIESLLAQNYGADRVLVRQRDYIGPTMALELVKETVFYVVLALILMLVYIWFRFKLAYGVAAIAALVHDTLITLGIIALFKLEFSTSTVAAILTLIGYSINDTIVVFDRIRENNKLMTGQSFETIIDTSITQTLSRTIITSLTTVIAILGLLFLTTGTVQVFSFVMTFGVVIGTYSSIFIASPILYGWIVTEQRRKKAKESQQYHLKEGDKPEPTKLAPDQQTSAVVKEETVKPAESFPDSPQIRRNFTRKQRKKNK